MRLLDILDAISGRVKLPTKIADGTPVGSELWLVATALRYRDSLNALTQTVLTDALLDAANGVPQLDADGLIPLALLPSAAIGGVSVPIGGGIDHYGDPASIPTGFLVCDGSEYLRTEYPALFAKVKTRWGRPTSDLYFRVPDRIGRVGYGAWSYGNSGLIRRATVITRGQGYTPGTYTFTFTGGTFASAATGQVVIVNEFVPGVGTTGVVDHVDIITPGSYTDTTGVAIPNSALPSGTGCVYEVQAQPVAAVRSPYSFAVQVSVHGTGYTSSPEVTIGGGSLVGATAIAIVRDGGVAEVIVTNPGNGNIAGASVAFSGGGGASAAATLVRDLAYVLQGDFIGQEKHVPLLEELVTHHHAQGFAAGGTIGGGATGASTNTSDTGSSYATQRFTPGIGVVPLIRAL